MNPQKLLNQKRLRRDKRVRAKISGTALRPRFSVFRSNRYTYVQLIDDEKGETIASASVGDLGKTKRQSKISLSETLGGLIAKKAKEKGVEKVVFDRGSYAYHGRVKAIAEAARKAGLQI